MFEPDKIDCKRMLDLIQSDYWQEAMSIRDAVSYYRKAGNQLKQLQEMALIFTCGVLYGEDQTIQRMKYLEKQVADLTHYNGRLEEALKNATKSTQDVKQEE